jgi:hypothetical protein
MNYQDLIHQDLIHDAINIVLAWEIPDEAFSEAVEAQACLMAGIHPEEIRGLRSD